MGLSIAARRWIAGLLSIAAIFLLALENAVRHFTVFSPLYVSPYHTAATLAGMLYVIAVWAIAHHGTAQVRFSMAAVASSSLIAGALAFVLYHADHVTPMRFVWDRWESVTPFHVQLAAPFAIAALAGLATSLVTLGDPPRDVLPSARARLRSR